MSITETSKGIQSHALPRLNTMKH